MNKATVVLFPSSGVGHLIPMVELAKLLTYHDLSTVILLADSSIPSSSSIDTLVASIVSSCPLISFHRLEVPPPPSPPSDSVSLVFGHLPRANPLLSSFLRSKPSVCALILDMFCTAALDVASELNIPSYFFFASGASCLAAFITLPKLATNTNSKDAEDSSTLFQIPGLPPIPASHVPNGFREFRSAARKASPFDFERLPTAKGILVNTFEMLEERAVRALADGLCACPVYCIGPLIADRKEEEHECLKWLDEQPKQSVVFLCWGSMGMLSAEQVREIAAGLERSEQRFLWVVRGPPSEDFERPEPDLDVLMPEGFLERTRGRGMVVRSWAPQAAVLEHEAVGGFVTHCGWNSVLEGVSCGVPLVAWPLFAEQKMTKVLLTEEAKVAVEMEGYDKGMVSADEVEAKVRWLMESVEGKELKDRAAAMKECAVAARKHGGLSDSAWKEFVSALLNNY